MLIRSSFVTLLMSFNLKTKITFFAKSKDFIKNFNWITKRMDDHNLNN